MKRHFEARRMFRGGWLSKGKFVCGMVGTLLVSCNYQTEIGGSSNGRITAWVGTLAGSLVVLGKKKKNANG